LYDIIHKVGEAKGLIITGIVTVAILVGGIFFLSKGSSSPSKPVVISSNILISKDSHQTNPNAKVTIVEFGDYRCPACKEAYPTVKQVLNDYGNKINFVFRNYAFIPDPGASTTNASTLAANAAECASDQSKFMEMHDYLYANQPAETDASIYNLDNLTKVAGTLGIDTGKFKTCLSNKTDDARVKQDFADGQLAQITGTPSFFVNGQLLPGIPSYTDFKLIIDQLIKQ